MLARLPAQLYDNTRSQSHIPISLSRSSASQGAIIEDQIRLRRLRYRGSRPRQN